MMTNGYRPAIFSPIQSIKLLNIQRFSFSYNYHSVISARHTYGTTHSSDDPLSELHIKHPDLYDKHGVPYTERPSPWGIPVSRIYLYHIPLLFAWLLLVILPIFYRKARGILLI
jgi:hypothetical protein